MLSILKKNVVNPKHRKKMWAITAVLCVAPAIVNLSDFTQLLKKERVFKFFDQAGVVSCVYREYPKVDWSCRNDSGGALVDIIPFEKKTWLYNDIGHAYYVERVGSANGIIYTFKDEVDDLFIKELVN